MKGHSNNRKHKYNENFFEIIDNEYKAYWLGFIAADGYINARGNTTGITLHVKDINHLQKFLDHLGATSTKIHLRTGRYDKHHPITNKCYINLYSVKMNRDLQKLGISITKSNTLKPLSSISEHLIPHFIRGYFDGDGCVYETYSSKSGKKYVKGGISFTGTFDFLTFIHNKLPIKVPKLDKDNRVKTSYTLRYVSNLRFMIMKEYFYKEANVYLNRKFEKFKIIEEKIIRGSETKEEPPLKEVMI